jgi:hypothetical protein
MGDEDEDGLSGQKEWRFSKKSGKNIFHVVSRGHDGEEGVDFIVVTGETDISVDLSALTFLLEC